MKESKALGPPALEPIGSAARISRSKQHLCCTQSKPGCVAINLQTSLANAFLGRGLTQRRSPTGTRKVIGFENAEENNKRQMPVGVSRQNDCRSDRKTEDR